MSPEQIQKINEFGDFIVIHPMYRNALATIHRSIEVNRITNRNNGAVLVGAPGTGKTRVCDQISSEYLLEFNTDDDNGKQKILPVVYAVVPSDATIKSTAIRLLRIISNEKVSSAHPLEALEYRLFNLLENIKADLLILDETQGILRTGTDRTVELCANWFKILTDTFKKSVLIVGEPECLKLIEHTALAGRFPYVAHLEEFNLGTPSDTDDFYLLIKAFAIEINNSMGFEYNAPLTDEQCVHALYALTVGNLRSLRNLLEAALICAFSRNDNTFKVSDLAFTGFNLNFPDRLTPKNPFELTPAELNKIIATPRKKRK